MKEVHRETIVKHYQEVEVITLQTPWGIAYKAVHKETGALDLDRDRDTAVKAAFASGISRRKATNPRYWAQQESPNSPYPRMRRDV